MKVPNNIFLVGPMGAGKSTVGRQLAKTLNMEFVDCDRE
ncbi:MAG: (d)CMP kinase, partial [Gammaproteobacteria bacterium]|nr:(d)CMP kinase [Gammaproteobacteria bacterium]